MMKKMVSLAMALAFIAMTASASFAAAKADCTVGSVSGDTVTLDCGGDAGNFSKGMNVTADKAKCEVESVSGSTVTLDCKKADKLEAGSTVKVKEKKKKAIEGC